MPKMTASMPSLVVEAPVGGAVLAQEIGAVPLAGRGSPQAEDLGAVPVGVVRRVGQLDDRGHAGFAEGRQVRGDLLGGLAVEVGVLGREADVDPGLRLRPGSGYGPGWVSRSWPR